MITNPGARTRALYKWESEDLLNRFKLVEPYTREGAELTRDWLWYRFHCKRMMPSIRFTWDPAEKTSYCQGCSQIFMIEADHNPLMVTHEVVHALGYGSRSNNHNKGFVLAYIRAMNIVFGWDPDGLLVDAHWRGLV